MSDNARTAYQVSSLFSSVFRLVVAPNALHLRGTFASSRKTYVADITQDTMSRLAVALPTIERARCRVTLLANGWDSQLENLGKNNRRGDFRSTHH
jgi:hypothetical protein